MKKWINLLKLGLLLCLSVILVGCNDDSTTKRKTDTTSSKTTSLTENKKTTSKTTSDSTNRTTKQSVTTKHNVTTENHVTTKAAEVEVKSYFLSVFNNDSEAGETTTFYRKKIKENESVTLTTIVNDGYYFVGWTDASTSNILSTNPTYTFTMPSKNLNIEANYSYVTLTVENEDNDGTISNYNNTKISPNKSITIKCTPNEGIKFDGWYDATTDELISDKEEYTFTMPKKNVKYIAKYDYAKLHLRLNNYDGEEWYTSPINTERLYSEAIYKCQIGDEIEIKLSRYGTVNFQTIYDELGNEISTDPYFTYTMTRKDAILTAYYGSDLQIKTTQASFTYMGIDNIMYKVAGEEEYTNTVTNFKIRLTNGYYYTFKAPEIEGANFLGWVNYYNSATLCKDYEYTFQMGPYETYMFPLYEKTIYIKGFAGEDYQDCHFKVQTKPERYADDLYEDVAEDGAITVYIGQYINLKVVSTDTTEGYYFSAWVDYDDPEVVIDSVSKEIAVDVSASTNGYKVRLRQI